MDSSGGTIERNPLKINRILEIAAPKTGQRFSGSSSESAAYKPRASVVESGGKAFPDSVAFFRIPNKLTVYATKRQKHRTAKPVIRVLTSVRLVSFRMAEHPNFAPY